jgi:hypothetical protein
VHCRHCRQETHHEAIVRVALEFALEPEVGPKNGNFS